MNRFLYGKSNGTNTMDQSTVRSARDREFSNVWDTQDFCDAVKDKDARQQLILQSQIAFKLFYQKVQLLQANPKHLNASLASFDAFLAHQLQQASQNGRPYGTNNNLTVSLPIDRRNHHTFTSSSTIDSSLDDVANVFIKSPYTNPSFLDFTTSTDLLYVLKPSHENPLQCIKLKHSVVHIPIPGLASRELVYLEIMNSFVDEQGRRCWAKVLHSIDPNSIRGLALPRESYVSSTFSEHSDASERTEASSCSTGSAARKHPRRAPVRVFFCHNGSLYRETKVSSNAAEDQTQDNHQVEMFSIFDIDARSNVPRLFVDMLMKSIRKNHTKRLELFIQWHRKAQVNQLQLLAQTKYFFDTRANHIGRKCRGCIKRFSLWVISDKQCGRCKSYFCKDCSTMVYRIRRTKHSSSNAKHLLKQVKRCSYCLGHFGPAYLLDNDATAGTSASMAAMPSVPLQVDNRLHCPRERLNSMESTSSDDSWRSTDVSSSTPGQVRGTGAEASFIYSYGAEQRRQSKCRTST